MCQVCGPDKRARLRGHRARRWRLLRSDPLQDRPGQDGDRTAADRLRHTLRRRPRAPSQPRLYARDEQAGQEQLRHHGLEQHPGKHYITLQFSKVK